MNDKKQLWSWAFIDWANSAFSLTVMTAFFPIFFTKYWCEPAGIGPEKSTMYLGLVNSAYAALIALTAPILGAIADQGKRKKRFLIQFTLLGAVSTALLGVVAQGNYVLAMLFFTIAAFGFAGNNTFYDALLTDISGKEDFDRNSSLGFAVGYFGSELLFILNTVMYLKPAWFGLADGTTAIKLAYWLTGLWWLLFTLPALFWVKERDLKPENEGQGSLVARGFRQFWKTFKELKEHKAAMIFLAAYIFYIDAVNTVISMAVDFGQKIGLDAAGLIGAIHMVQIIAIPATLFFGWIAGKTGPKKAIYAGLLVYTGICFWAWRMTTMSEFWVMAGAVGLVQGGVQALSRSYFARLIPAEKSGEFFGFYNMMGKFAAILGPALMGLSAAALGNRASILSLLVLFAAGAVILAKVPDEVKA